MPECSIEQTWCIHSIVLYRLPKRTVGLSPQTCELLEVLFCHRQKGHAQAHPGRAWPMLLRGRGPTRNERSCSSCPWHVTRVYGGGDPAVSDTATGGACRCRMACLQPVLTSSANKDCHADTYKRTTRALARGECRLLQPTCSAAARSLSSCSFHCRRCTCHTPRKPEIAEGMRSTHQVLPRAACAACKKNMFIMTQMTCCYHCAAACAPTVFAQPRVFVPRLTHLTPQAKRLLPGVQHWRRHVSCMATDSATGCRVGNTQLALRGSGGKPGSPQPPYLAHQHEQHGCRAQDDAPAQAAVLHTLDTTRSS